MLARSRALVGCSAVACGFVWATPAFAHPGHGGHELVDGWMHPFTGADHLLAMVAVGLLAVRMGGRALWIMPATFLGGMLVGGLLASAGVSIPGGQFGIVEYGISASALVLGLLIAATGVIPLKYGAMLVTLFALCHGHAHAAEMTTGGSLPIYAAGFLLATTLLHASGIVLGMAMAHWLDNRAVRLAGGLISIAGLMLLCGWIGG